MKYSRMVKQCENCGKEYTVPRCLYLRSRYCSRQCRRLGKIVVCAVCGKSFYVNKGRIAEHNYCSIKCAQGKRKTMMSCPVCGKVFYNKGNSSRRKYCSKTCSSSIRKRGVEKQCVQCGKKIYVQRCQDGENNFCGRKCQKEWHGMEKVTYICKICGIEFKWSPSRRNVKYCSIECRTKCPEWKRNAVIAGNLAQQNRKEPTSLEIAGRAILNAIGIVYEEQVLICDKFVVDVLVPSKNLVIQWDGDYWHGFKGATDDRQKKRMRLDKSQDAYMNKVGYKVIRFWEHEVNKEEENVRENIRRAIQ